MKNQEIDGNDYDKHQYRSEKLAESEPHENVQQTYLKQIIKKMTKDKKDREAR